MYQDKDQSQFEKEVMQSVEQINNRIEKSGWFYLIVIIIILFGFIYLYQQTVKRTNSSDDELDYAIEERIQLLEDQVESLQREIIQLKEE